MLEITGNYAMEGMREMSPALGTVEKISQVHSKH
jgi:hypothetical protein